ncbi:hypothetical protein JCM10450v2_006486 [Rhodotorula kratochvilovae]
MPPKPKGLKASKRAAPFDPSTVANDTSASSSVELNKEQTAPLDDDALTLADLFELRTTVLEILYPFPTSTTLDDADPDRLDEARSLLRGILHGCAVLEPLGPKCEYQWEGGDEEETAAEREAAEKRRADLGADKLQALGLDDDLAEGELLFLQGFALHYLGELFEPPEQVASAVRSNAAGTKRRKVDVREPQSRAGWYEAAYARLDRLYDGVIGDFYSNAVVHSDDDVSAIVALATAQYWLTLARYTDELLGADADEGEHPALEALLRADWPNYWDSPSFQKGLQPSCPGGRFHDYADSVLAFLRAAPARLALLEARVPGGPDAALAELERAAQNLDEFKGEHLADEEHARWAFLVDVVRADVLAARFLLLEDAVEAKYRPDAEDAPEDDGDDEGEVTPLPLDAEEVVAAKQASEEAIAAIRATLESFAELDKDVAHPSAKAAQYRKLEEVLLVSSALINPDEKDKAAAVEREIEQVRKEGGLLREGEEDGEGKGEGEKAQ